jgi:type II secretory ATPase GspE/PulE/Tfp pilus assembly ATPase PilB-like protein
MPEIDFTERLATETETETYLNKLLSDVMRTAASDLFLTSRKHHVDIAVRQMGSITSWGTLTREDGLRLIAHIKATAEMDVSRSPIPQDGRVNILLGDGNAIDLRLSTLPTLFGEDLAIRILDPRRMLLGVEDIGFHQVNMNRLISVISRPGGLVLVTGPTGMGKTTTLYACLNFLNDGTRKIHTLEDPIEFTLEGIHQSQVNLRRGVDFPDLLRGILRQSPDVIMVGEIRDAVTADIVVRAANSGQLVFATCHSGTTAGACEAMLVFGVKPQFLASSLLGIVTQRLVRKLCPDCKTLLHHDTEEAALKSMSIPNGCPKCGGTGYNGRLAVGEVLRATPEIKRLIRQSAPTSDIYRVAVEQGMMDLQTDAQRKLEEGLTSPDEIIRAIPSGFDL